MNRHDSGGKHPTSRRENPSREIPRRDVGFVLQKESADLINT
jgi:hypothetical protein